MFGLYYSFNRYYTGLNNQQRFETYAFMNLRKQLTKGIYNR